MRTTLRLTEPKSVRSRRTIRLPSIVAEALKQHRTRQRRERLAAGGAWEDTGLVFTSPIGSPLEPRNATREFHTILTAAKLPAIRFHDLRHTAATLPLAQGVDVRVIMETLGHSQVSLTLNTYSTARIATFMGSMCLMVQMSRTRRPRDYSEDQTGRLQARLGLARNGLVKLNWSRFLVRDPQLPQHR